MATLGLERETLLDVLVNVIPLAIIAAFILLTTFVRPWAFDPVIFVIAQGLHLVPFVLLAVLTYVAAKIIQRDEHRETG